MQSAKPNFLQISMLIMLAVGMTSHVFILPALLKTAGRDAWISLILSVPAVILFVLLLLHISRGMDSDPLTVWVGRHAGQAWAYFLRIVASLFCLVNAFSTFYETTIWTRINFLLNTPILITGMFLMLLCCLTAQKGLKALTGAAGILLPMTFVFGFSIAFINMKHKDYNQIFPIFEHGLLPAFKGSLFSMAGSFELLLLLFLLPKLSSKLKPKPFFILTAIILGFTMGPLMGAITEFNPYEAQQVRFPAYEEWRLATVGKYNSQTDFLSLFQWISGAFIRISLFLYVTVDLWNIKTVQRRKKLIFFLSTLFILVNLIPLSDMKIHRLTVEWLYPSNLVFFCTIAALLGITSCIARRRKKRGRTTG